MFQKTTKPNVKFLLCGLFLLVFTLVTYIFQLENSMAAEAREKTASQYSSQDLQDPNKLSPAEINTFLDSLSDQQIRQALAQVLEQASAGNASPRPFTPARLRTPLPIPPCG